MKLRLLIVGLVATLSLNSQTTAVWQDIAETALTLPAEAEVAIPTTDYRTLSLSRAELDHRLQSAPFESRLAIRTSTTVLDIPLPDGSTERFRLVESPVMASELQARYPQIRSYRAFSLEAPARNGRLAVSPYGIEGIFQSRAGEVNLTSYDTGALSDYYVTFFTRDAVLPADAVAQLACGYTGAAVETEVPSSSPDRDRTNARTTGDPLPLRVYDLALTNTGEYGNAYGGTVESVLARMNMAMNRLNQILENEVSVRLQMINQNDQLIFLDGDTDPFMNPDNGTGLLGQVENAIVNVGNIPFSFFDLGHVFTLTCEDVGGVVSGSACTSGKTRGVTCHYSSNLNLIVTRVMAHEIAHQFNVAHSWSNCEDNTEDNEVLGQLAPGSAYEPGSGTTIMSYAGSCGPQNVQFNSDDYYHVRSLEQFINYTREGNASDCATELDLGNTEPTVFLDYEDGFYIPIRTPFELTGFATDMEDDSLTYTWEQYNLGPLSDLGSPAGNAPSFRSFYPDTNPNRVFPRWDVILNNLPSVTEVLPTYSRDLSFRCTVRDNHPTNGAVAWEQVDFFATAEAGPFLVTYPNTGSESLEVGEYITVTWDVANTDQAPVNCKMVNVLLSVDGGFTYPYTLVNGVPNNGQTFVTIPDAISNNARIRVQAADNIFFDVSNENFSIVPPTAPTYTLGVSPIFQQICLPTTADILIETGSILGFDTTIVLSVIADDLPAGATAFFNQDTVSPGDNAVLTLDFNDVTYDGPLTIDIQAMAGSNSTTRTLYFELVDNDFSELDLLTPVDGTTGINLSTPFDWESVDNAVVYDFQLATSAAFDTTIISEAFGLIDSEFAPSVLLENNELYFWRIRPVNECGPGEWLEPFVFHTVNSTCAPEEAVDVPITIPGTGPLPTRESTITVPFAGTISDLNLDGIQVNYQPVNSLRISLISPAGTEVILYDQNCGTTNTVSIGFDDEAPNEIQCAPDDGIVFRPIEPLATFDGEDSQGTWTLRVQVLASGFGSPGSISNWSLEFCATGTPVAPIVITNEPLGVPPGEENTITTDQLEVSSSVVGPADLTYTLVTPPAHGNLFLAGQPLQPGDRFRQLSINSFNVTYAHSNDGSDTDRFTFVVEDGEGGFIPTQEFLIVIDENATVGTQAPQIDLSFDLFPNPTQDWVQLRLPSPLSEEAPARLLTLDGRLVQQTVLPIGSDQWQFQTQHLPKGLYLVQVTSGSRTGIKRLLVQ